MTLQRWISLLLCCVLVLVVGGQASAQVVDYTEVPDWPDPATSAAGTPAAWNFGQVSAVATSANGTILVLHRGAQPIMSFDNGGRFVHRAVLDVLAETLQKRNALLGVVERIRAHVPTVDVGIVA